MESASVFDFGPRIKSCLNGEKDCCYKAALILEIISAYPASDKYTF